MILSLWKQKIYIHLLPIDRWKGGRGIKLKGSDHAPVCMSLNEVPNILQHSTPLLSTRYCPQVEGCQQTLGAMNLYYYLDENISKINFFID